MNIPLHLSKSTFMINSYWKGMTSMERNSTESGNPSPIVTGNRTGSIILLSIFVDEWNYFSVPMLSLFIEKSFLLNSYLLGSVTGAVIAGSSLGSLLGGWLTDRFGRKRIFTVNMLLFIFSALVTAFSPSVAIFIAARFIAGIPIGSDLANGYAYLMESLPPGKREITGTKNTLMASLAIVSINIAALILTILGNPPSLVWKISILASIIPALAALVLVHRLGESIHWELSRSHKSGSNANTRSLLAPMSGDPVLRRTSIFSWISGAASTIEVGTFAFFIPLIIASLGISGETGSRLIILAVYSVGIPAGYLGPLIVSRIGLKRLSYGGYAITLLAIMGSGLGLILRIYYIVPLFIVLFVWGNHWNSQPILTSQSLVADPALRGRLTGIANFAATVPAFITTFLFPSIINSVGLGLATLLVVAAPASGLYASLFIFREIFGYSSDLNVSGPKKVIPDTGESS